jgi:hypothetical protein
MAAKYHERSTI